MARQRFVHPSMWTDKNFGSLRLEERVLFVALFSNADDDGRIVADPGVLRGLAFAFDDYTLKKVAAIRDSLASKMAHVCLYTNGDGEYIALLKWNEYQRPQYRKPSKLPPPPSEDSTNPHGSLVEASHRGFGLGLGSGLGRAVDAKGPTPANGGPPPREPEARPADEPLQPPVLSHEEARRAIAERFGAKKGAAA